MLPSPAMPESKIKKRDQKAIFKILKVLPSEKLQDDTAENSSRCADSSECIQKSQNERKTSIDQLHKVSVSIGLTWFLSVGLNLLKRLKYLIQTKTLEKKKRSLIINELRLVNRCSLGKNQAK